MSDVNANYSASGSDSASSAAASHTAQEDQEDLESTAKFNREELVRGWREYEAKLPRIVPLLKYAAKTDMGQVRENNEDKFDYYEPETPAILAARGSLFAVADGIGGALAGQIASEMMLKQLIAGYYDHASPDLQTALWDSIAATNDRVYSLAQMIPERSGMGTTLTAAVFVEERVVVAQVGDSRAYLIRDGKIAQITQDHSWVEEQVRAGMMSRTDAEMSPFRNVITRSIGASSSVQPDFFVETTRVGDVWVLCSDGLTGHVDDTEIARIAAQNAPSEAARQLIELANARGGRDNVTVFVLAVRDLISLPSESRLEPGAQSGENAATGRINTVPDPVRPASRCTDVAPNAVASTAFLQPVAAMPGGVSPVSPSLQGDRPRSGWRRLFRR